MTHNKSILMEKVTKIIKKRTSLIVSPSQNGTHPNTASKDLQKSRFL